MTCSPPSTTFAPRARPRRGRRERRLEAGWLAHLRRELGSEELRGGLDPDGVGHAGETSRGGDEFNRSWVFRTVGYGHDEKWWRDFVSTLKTIGYDGALSIEHEDSLMSIEEGFRKAVETLKGAVIAESAGEMWWA